MAASPRTLPRASFDEIAEIRMARIGRALAVIAGEVRDDRPLFRRQAHDVGVLDEVVAVFVVTRVVNVIADVVQDGSRAQEHSIANAERVHGLKVVEQLRGEA